MTCTYWHYANGSFDKSMHMDLEKTKGVPNSTPLEIILSQDKRPTKLREGKVDTNLAYIHGRQGGSTKLPKSASVGFVNFKSFD